MRAALALVLLVSSPAIAAPIVGRASVIDGDTLEIRGIRIRLLGIDAPESGQVCQNPVSGPYRCGQVAALALADHIGASPLSCEPHGHDQYRRIVAVCSLGAEDLNGWLVAKGLAVAAPRYSRAYVLAEERAKTARAGIWAGSFELPWEWRHRR